MNTEAQRLCKSIMNDCINDFSKSTCDFQDGDGATTIDASCFAVSDTKSSANQTDRYRKLRNKTTTTEVQLVPKIERKVDPKAHVCDIHAIITLNVVARNPDEHVQSVSVEPSVKMVTQSSLTESKQCNKCTCTKDECAESGECVESCQYSCKYGGIGPCNAFSLGTADFRMLLREKCNSMLIGGCRVPVCRNFKNKL